MSEITAGNVFEKIISGEIPAYKIYEDEHTIAFLDTSPINEGHTLVVPKIKSRNIFDVSKENFSQVMDTVQKISPVIREVLGADGVNIHINNEPAAGQKVLHLHVHIIPRFEKDGFEHWHGKKQFSKEDMEKLTEKIKSSF